MGKVKSSIFHIGGKRISFHPIMESFWELRHTKMRNFVFNDSTAKPISPNSFKKCNWDNSGFASPVMEKSKLE